jgi:hypothetical protein
MSAPIPGEPGISGGVPGPPPITLFRQRSQLAAVYGTLIAVFVLALIRGELGAATTGGRIAVAAYTGTFIILLTVSAIVVGRRHDRIEVTRDAITHLRRNGRQITVLSRAQGGELRLVRRGGGARYRAWALTNDNRSFVDLWFFSRNAVQAACLKRDWHF